jgi:hypothetical protein
LVLISVATIIVRTHLKQEDKDNHPALETGGILVGDEATITLDVEFVKA